MRSIKHIAKQERMIEIDIGLIEGYDSKEETYQLHLLKTSRKVVCSIPEYMKGTITVGVEVGLRYTSAEIAAYIGSYAVVVNPVTKPVIVSLFV